MLDLSLQQREIQMSFRGQEIAFSAPLRAVKAFAALSEYFLVGPRITIHPACSHANNASNVCP